MSYFGELGAFSRYSAVFSFKKVAENVRIPKIKHIQYTQNQGKLHYRTKVQEILQYAKSFVRRKLCLPKFCPMRYFVTNYST